MLAARVLAGQVETAADAPIFRESSLSGRGGKVGQGGKVGVKPSAGQRDIETSGHLTFAHDGSICSSAGDLLMSPLSHQQIVTTP
jgi:hypothetical protein